MLIKDKILLLGLKNKKTPYLNNLDVLDGNLIIPRIFYLLSKADVIVVDEATEEFYANTARENWEFEKHFDCVLSTFDVFFLETKKPSLIKSEIGFDDGSRLPNQWGVLFQKITRTSGFSKAEVSLIYDKLNIKMKKRNFLYALNFCFDSFDNKDNFNFPEVTSFMLINSDGKIIRNPLFLPSLRIAPFINQIEPAITQFSLSAMFALDTVNSLKWEIINQTSSASGEHSDRTENYYILKPYDATF